jgi:hypothetical protein
MLSCKTEADQAVPCPGFPGQLHALRVNLPGDSQHCCTAARVLACEQRCKPQAVAHFHAPQLQRREQLRRAAGSACRPSAATR